MNYETDGNQELRVTKYELIRTYETGRDEGLGSMNLYACPALYVDCCASYVVHSAREHTNTTQHDRFFSRVRVRMFVLVRTS